jgi:hypothetical protein
LVYGSWVKESLNPNQNTENRAALWRIFSSNKIAPANSKTGFYAKHCDQRLYDMNGIFQMQGGKNWFLPK